MTTKRSLTDVSIDRVGGRSFPRWRISLALAALVLIGLTQTGCRSNGCSSCNLGSKLTSGVQSLNARLFKPRDRGGCGTCGTLGGSEEGVIVDSGFGVAPGQIAIPAPGTIVPPPTIESGPTQLEAIPSAAHTGTPSRNVGGANRSAYEAVAPRTGIVASKPRGSDLSRAYQSASSPSPASYALEEPDLLDNLPPVDLPADLSRKVEPSETTVPKELKIAPDGGAPSSSPAPPAGDLSAKTPIHSSSAEQNSAGDRLVLPQARPATAPTRVAPGMTRWASVAPTVAGGGLPAAEGLTWLKEKGYRTLVDLRQRSEVSPTFPDEVTDQGMLYVAIPFSVDPITLSRLVRFNDLMTQNDQRPLYFCDTDGRRAGLLWYLRLRGNDHEEASLARSKAEEIGLQAGDVAVAEAFLKLNFAAQIDDLPTVATLPSSPVETPLTPPPAISPASSKISPASLQVTSVAEVRRDWTPAPPTFDPFGRGTSWKPVTALVLSGLGVPLAYWSRTTLFQKRTPRRASLTAKGPGPRKALPASDA